MRDQTTAKTAAAFTLLALLCSCRGGNVFHSEPHRLLPPPDYSQRESTLFGYSAAFQELSSGEKLLMVGAPTASDDGNVFACALSARSAGSATNTTCQTIPVDVYSSKVHDYVGGTYYFHDHKTWLGATIAAIGRDKFITCAPRWFMSTGRKMNHYGVFGACYEVEMKHRKRGKMITTPKNEWGCNLCSYYLGSNGGYGWSLAVQNDTLHVGGPAVCTSGSYYSTNIWTYYERYDRQDITYSYDLFESNCKADPPVRATINFGYVMALGYFLAPYYGETIAVSSPYGRHGYGMVSIINDGKEIRNIRDSKVGSLFGAALCSVSLKDRAQTDLLVGAPSYTVSEDYPENGAVFLFIGGAPLYETKDAKPTATLLGAKGKQRSYFGSTIANLGDLDGDGRDDFAVGAPYEEDVGAVYVFMGSAFEIKSTVFEYLQRIIPGHKGFGSSIIPLPDIDHNSCNEMAVGAIDDATVSVLHCLPFVTVTIQPDPDLQMLWTLPVNATNFKFESCVQVQYPKDILQITGQLAVMTTLSESTAIINPDDRVYEIILNKSNTKPICRKISVKTELPFVADRMAITMEVTMLKDCFKEVYDPKCAVLSQKSVLRYSEYLTTSRGCGEVCNPVLNFNISMQSDMDPRGFKVGSLEAVTVQIHVQNSAQTAYDWCVTLSVDGADSEMPSTGGCQRSKTPQQYICNPKPLFPGGVKVISVILYTRRLTSAHTSIVLTANVKAKCKSSIDQIKNITIDLFVDPEDIVIKSGLSENVVTIDKKDIYEQSEKRTTFEHTYWIENKGPTNWVSVIMEVVSPKYEYLIMGLPQGEDMSCSYLKRRDSVQDFIIRCIFNNIKRFSSYNVTVPLIVIHSIVAKGLDKEVNITTFAEISNPLVSKERQKAQFQTVMRTKYTEGVKWWYILLACILAVVILGLLAFVLYKTGFFRREVKQNLNELKRKSMKAGRESLISPT